MNAVNPDIPMPSTMTLSVMIVDDSDMLRACLRRLIDTLPGLNLVGEATNAIEAVARFEDLRPDIVILDIQMPGGSGIEVLKWIKKRTPACRVVMASSCPPQIYGPLCIEHGADHYFDKANDMDKLVDLLIPWLPSTTNSPPAPAAGAE